MDPPRTSAARPQNGASSEPWHIKLYIAGWTPSSMAALRSVKILEEEYLPPNSTVEIIDLLEQPAAGVADNVLAIPMIVRVRPTPVRRIVGNLNDIAKALKILGFSNEA